MGAQKLVPSTSCEHRPSHYTACGQALAEGSGGCAYTAWDEIEVAAREAGELEGRRYRLLELQCGWGHVSRA